MVLTLNEAMNIAHVLYGERILTWGLPFQEITYLDPTTADDLVFSRQSQLMLPPNFINGRSRKCSCLLHRHARGLLPRTVPAKEQFAARCVGISNILAIPRVFLGDGYRIIS